MKLTFPKVAVDALPAAYTRVTITDEARGTKHYNKIENTLTIGAGKPRELTRRKFIILCRSVIRAARENKVGKVAIPFGELAMFSEILADTPKKELAFLATQNFEMARYEFTTYKTPPKEGWPQIQEVALCGVDASGEAEAKRGLLVGQEVNACRELSNTPGGHMTPKVLAAAAKSAVAGTTAIVKVLGVKEMEKLGMGAVLGVGRGSTEEPQFIIAEYWGAPKKEAPIVLVGKGVTFDTGGLNIKTGSYMYEMHMDMSGGAAVIHALALAARLKSKVNVIALVPAVENATSSNAVRPGDILKSLSGKTIEVVDTDAEGRVILADGITYAKRYSPGLVVDVATLTGAALTALGTQASAIMSMGEGMTHADYVRLGEETGDYVWPLPLGDEYTEMTQSNFADIANYPASSGHYGGVINGGMFLREFAKDLGCPWLHIDMAPRMTTTSNDLLGKGAAGAPVRFLFALISHYATRTPR